MTIPSTLISNAFLPGPVSGCEAIHSGCSGALSSDDIFLIGLLIFFNQFHQSILSAWQNFQKNQSNIRDQKESGERPRKLRTPDVRIQQNEGQRLFHEVHNGSYMDPSARQLNLPV